ncbi:uncharacterized protein LOC126974928 isoform X1 [Leptidea sinapis]|uniref:uncharacterized protein LOC126974928 isoform X1 n=1 Tax=Leptidea sinapis TaxID=189913 RepID=UPI00212779EB|nr:uncharacterized protein LOC126974928 isoform X1 [Leptidea sinapis]
MKYHNKMEWALISITSVLCTLMVIKFLYNLRTALPWRVNCWFCNSNFWIKFINRNCWTCPGCEQYNGFTKDGDYNKVLITNNEYTKIANVFQRSPPKNGLCKMCNINQQLKVTQMANFIPMSENNFDQEIGSYKAQLEKAYKLCSPCKKVLQVKLHKEKESLLGSKLLETRTPEKKNVKKDKRKRTIQKIINNISKIFTGILLVLVTVELHDSLMKHKNLYKTMYNIKNILYNILERIFSIVKMKTFMTFPFLEDYLHDISSKLNIELISINADILDWTQKALGGFAASLQIIGHICNLKKNNFSLFIDLMWMVFVVTSMIHGVTHANPLLVTSVKEFIILALFLLYRRMENEAATTVRKVSTPKKNKNFANGSVTMQHSDDVSYETDNDVSLSQFGLYNHSSSSSESFNHLNNSYVNGRSFTPRSDILWSKPKHNSSFSINSMVTKSPSISESVFARPAYLQTSFNKYQNLVKDDSDSDLDESIGSLCISSPKKKSSKINPVFALRKFTASPNFVTPMPVNRNRPLISPSKLGYSTSWVAGGYWGTDGERNIFPVNGSRSSSQSSGFESQTSSQNYRNMFSQPPSREESICRDTDKTVLDRFQNCNIMNYPQKPIQPSMQGFTPLQPPVFPQMQYNNHVRIPQPRLAQQTFVSQNVYSQHDMFKSPGRSGLIKLPSDNSFTSS